MSIRLFSYACKNALATTVVFTIPPYRLTRIPLTPFNLLVRVKQVNFAESCKEYKDDDIDGQKIRISVE